MAALLKKRTFILLLSLIVILAAAYFILPVSIPLITALVTALFLSPAVHALHKRVKIKRHIAVLIVFTLFVCFIGFTGYYLTTQAVTQGTLIIENLPQYINDLNRAWLNFQRNLESEFENLPPDLVQEINFQVTQALNEMRATISDRNLINDVASIISSIPGYFVTFIVYLIALFLFMLELPSLKQKLYTFFSEKTKEKVNFMTARLTFVIWGFFKAQFLVSIIIFIVSLIGLLFIDPEVALLMSFIIWIIDFIPLIGSIVILAPWAIFQLIVGDVSTGTQLLILAAVLLIIRRTVEPKVMGQQIGLSPLATLIAMYLGLVFFGIMGFVIGPLIVIAFTSAKEAGIIKMNFKI
ncbi:sporulation integral membrane protein YtvI [Halalkalibacter nanhaiisediminis]|uniref:Sporulation integral membrane protein YtvI n=1 Tax=Halalkalibacter nanhaiisediminis TaxID=688079 RepID=A0A562QGD0_9BACI|nr:sporulation integral membrane protein YtvI [Halalkalibacter nanhaiisediminis]TWI55812.1 sporulation integral membrane protein YtvI [Halalkalibacter nanhaiisediminis]